MIEDRMVETNMRIKILAELAEQDFVRVTYCKDCIHCNKTSVTWCIYHDTHVTDKGYCFWGKRRNAR